MIMSVLIAGCGTQVENIVEILGVTNWDTIPLYTNHPECDSLQKEFQNKFFKDPVREIWVYSTNNDAFKTAYKKLHDFLEMLTPAITLKAWLIPAPDIDSPQIARTACELATRLLLEASRRSESNGNKCYVSLSGGRKTMATDLYWAGTLFGAACFIHVLEKNTDMNKRLKIEALLDAYGRFVPPPQEIIENYIPLVEPGIAGNPAVLHYIQKKDSRKSMLAFSGDTTVPHIWEAPAANTSLVNEIRDILKQAGNLHIAMVQDNSEKLRSNFPVLYTFAPQQIKEFSTTMLTGDFAQRLPKLDLHCHLGGALAVADSVAIAYEVCKENNWKPYSLNSDKTMLNKIIESLRGNAAHAFSYRERMQALAAYYDRAEALEAYWYGAYVDPEQFCGIGFEKYEALGNLQGSVLLQTKTAITQAVKRLLENAQREHCIGLELRCSPGNYTREGLTSREVAACIFKALHEYRGKLEVGVLFIASRHRRMSEVYAVIELYQELVTSTDSQERKLFEQYFKGFDVAGNEQTRRPIELRQALLQGLQDCRYITIHAGETENAESIWEAVYNLNAERIGHGLTLSNNNQLKQKFKDRGIGIELCPSSNYQICRADGKTYSLEGPGKGQTLRYPLREYLDEGLKVTVNTDNAGISRTSISNEFMVASNLIGGMSVLDSFQLVKNSIDVSFLGYEAKTRMMKRAEKEIMELINTIKAE